MKTVEINGIPREATGKGAARQARREGRIPAIIYGGDNKIAITIDPMEVRDLIYTGDFKLANVNADGSTYKCLLKETQFHPVFDNIIHMDFQILIPGKKVKLDLPIFFEGTPIGVSQGGVLVKKLRKLAVITTTDYMMDHIVADVTELNLGDSYRVRELTSDSHILIQEDPGTPLAAVEIPRAMKDMDALDAEAEAEAEAAAEGEVEGEGEAGVEGEAGAETAAPADGDENS